MTTRSLTLLAFLAAGPALAAETDITFRSGANEIVGTLNLPDGVESPPVVLMLHGFTGQRQEFPTEGSDVGLFAHASEAIAGAGIASLRIDFAGSGDSGGEWADTTFSSQIADAVAAFDYLQAMDGVDHSKVGILGYSQGGLVGAHLAGLRPEAAAVVLWAPVTNPMATYSGLLGADTVAKALSEDAATPVTANLSWGGQTTLNASFYHELATTSPTGAVARYEGPLEVIVGLKETIVTPQPASGQILLDYHEGTERLVTVDSDHDWDWSSTSTSVDEVLLPATVEWFQEHFF